MNISKIFLFIIAIISIVLIIKEGLVVLFPLIFFVYLPVFVIYLFVRLSKDNKKLKEIEKEHEINTGMSSPCSKASSMCAGVSLLIFPTIFGIAAIILGIIAKSRGEEKEGLSTLGIVIGIISIIIGVFFNYAILNNIFNM